MSASNSAVRKKPCILGEYNSIIFFEDHVNALFSACHDFYLSVINNGIVFGLVPRHHATSSVLHEKKKVWINFILFFWFGVTV